MSDLMEWAKPEKVLLSDEHDCVEQYLELYQAVLAKICGKKLGIPVELDGGSLRCPGFVGFSAPLWVRPGPKYPKFGRGHGAGGM